MAINLKIANIKNIKGLNEFNSLEFVNYLVGKNSCGKSSVLNAVAMLSLSKTGSFLVSKNPQVQDTFMQGAEASVEIEIHGEVKKIYPNGNKIEITGNLQFDVITDQDFSDFSYANKYRLPKTTFENLETSQGSVDDANLFNRLNKIIEFLKLKPIDVTIEKPATAFDKIPPRFFSQNNIKIRPQFLAQGIKSMEKLEAILEKIRITADQNKKRLIFALIEEPENNLHPEMQKQIPIIIDSFIREHGLENKVIFFIATHSPFIINSSKNFATQKIFRIENGKNIDSNGFNGGFKMKEVAMLLGADPTDIGLTENLCLVEESSICSILNSCKEKGLLKDYNFISCSGVTRAVKFKERIENLSIYNTFFLCHPLYLDTYHIIIDQVPLSEKNNEKYKKLTSIGEKRFHELKNVALEDYYENFDNSLFNEFNIRKNSGEEIGTLKNELAIKIAKKISTVDDFKKLFKNELDFLVM